MDYTKEINEIKEKLELMKVQNQDTEEEDTEEEDTEEEDTEEEEVYTEEDQVNKFLDAMRDYKSITFIVKLAFHKYFSYLKREEYIRECDAEEFSKSDLEFQNLKMRFQNALKKDLLTDSYDDYNFALKSFRIYCWKLMGLFN